MTNLAIIPARGGSKRIPRKNIKHFLGKPIIAYSIEAALNSKLFDKVIVSTDDLEIAEVAIKYGACVPFLRSKENSNDMATTFSVIKEVLMTFDQQNKKFEHVCCIYPCAPFINKEILVKGYNQYLGKNYDSLFPIMPFNFPIQRSLEIKDEKLRFIYPQFSLTRSQDLELAYHDAGQFYWMNSKICLTKKSLITDNTGYITITELEGQDIDNLTDWKLAELKYEIIRGDK